MRIEKILKTLLDFTVLLFLTASILSFSVIVYIRYIWPEIDFEQLLITLKDISVKFLIDNASVKDYIFAFLFFAVIYPLCYCFLNTKGRLGVALLFSGAVLYFSGYASYQIYSRATSHLYEEEYIFPEKLQYTFPEKKRNLILIYLESFEHNFAKSEHYEQNLLPHLSGLWKEGEYSLKHQPMYGTDYSIASLVSSQCGIPLRFTYIDDIWALQFFLPRAVCFPEILKQNGYQTAIIKAADITFTRADKYAKSHGYDEALGVDEILEHYSEEERSEHIGTFGGATDETLFSFAKDKLAQFSADKPFMLTLFTLDTHTPTSYYNPKCTKTFNDIRDVYMCSDKTVYDFVMWLKASPYWDNTTVVLMGDHVYPSRLNAKGHPKRGIYNVFLNLPENMKINKNMPFTTMDMAPTILESLGVQLSQRAFGLGRSLFSDKETLLQRLGRQKLKIQLIQDSNIYKAFNVSKQKREEEFTPYRFGTKITDKDFLKYSDSYEEVFGNYYLDTLGLKLSQSTAQKYVVSLKFRALKSWNKRVSFYANGKEVLTYDIDYKTLKPFDVTFEIPAQIIKNGELKLTFRKGKGRLMAAQMGINPVEMVLLEK